MRDKLSGGLTFVVAVVCRSGNVEGAGRQVPLKRSRQWSSMFIVEQVSFKWFPAADLDRPLLVLVGNQCTLYRVQSTITHMYGNLGHHDLSGCFPAFRGCFP